MRTASAGERMIGSARQALAFAQGNCAEGNFAEGNFAEGNRDHGCEVYVPDGIEVRSMRNIGSMDGEFPAGEPDAVGRDLLG